MAGQPSQTIDADTLIEVAGHTFVQHLISIQDRIEAECNGEALPEKMYAYYGGTIYSKSELYAMVKVIKSW